MQFIFQQKTQVLPNPDKNGASDLA